MNVRVHVYLFSYLFVYLWGRFGTQYSHILYKTTIFSNFSGISGTSGHAEMGGHPWVNSLDRSHHLSLL